VHILLTVVFIRAHTYAVFSEFVWLLLECTGDVLK